MDSKHTRRALSRTLKGKVTQDWKVKYLHLAPTIEELEVKKQNPLSVLIADEINDQVIVNAPDKTRSVSKDTIRRMLFTDPEGNRQDKTKNAVAAYLGYPDYIAFVAACQAGEVLAYVPPPAPIEVASELEPAEKTQQTSDTTTLLEKEVPTLPKKKSETVTPQGGDSKKGYTIVAAAMAAVLLVFSLAFSSGLGEPVSSYTKDKYPEEHVFNILQSANEAEFAAYQNLHADTTVLLQYFSSKMIQPILGVVASRTLAKNCLAKGSAQQFVELKDVTYEPDGISVTSLEYWRLNWCKESQVQIIYKDIDEQTYKLVADDDGRLKITYNGYDGDYQDLLPVMRCECLD